MRPARSHGCGNVSLGSCIGLQGLLNIARGRQAVLYGRWLLTGGQMMPWASLGDALCVCDPDPALYFPRADFGIWCTLLSWFTTFARLRERVLAQPQWRLRLNLQFFGEAHARDLDLYAAQLAMPFKS